MLLVAILDTDCGDRARLTGNLCLIDTGITTDVVPCHRRRAEDEQPQVEQRGRGGKQKYEIPPLHERHHVARIEPLSTSTRQQDGEAAGEPILLCHPQEPHKPGLAP
ncbi:MAG: hypothetical protein U0031_15000 [Thermomicrobiales bacterium]